MNDWDQEPREVPDELNPDYPHAVYPPAPTFFPPLADRIDETIRTRLLDMAGQ